MISCGCLICTSPVIFSSISWFESSCQPIHVPHWTQSLTHQPRLPLSCRPSVLQRHQSHMIRHLQACSLWWASSRSSWQSAPSSFSLEHTQILSQHPSSLYSSMFYFGLWEDDTWVYSVALNITASFCFCLYSNSSSESAIYHACRIRATLLLTWVQELIFYAVYPACFFW